MNINWLIRVACLLLLFVPSRRGEGQTLDYYLEKGLQNSPLLKDFAIQQQTVLLDSLKILAGNKPQAGLSAEIMYPPAFGKFAYDSALSDGGHYISLIRVDQQLFYRKNAHAQLQNVLIQKLITGNSLRATETELRESITAQFLTAFADLKQYEFGKSLNEELKDQQNILRQLVDKGIYQETDYQNLKISVASGSIAVKQSFRQYKNDLALLNLLCGIHDTTTVLLKQPVMEVRSRFDLNATPGMERFRIDSLKNLTDRLLLDMAYRPKVGAYIDAGFNSINPLRIPYNLGTSIGVSFSMPLYDGRQKELEIKRISLSEKNRLQYRNAFETGWNQKRDQLMEQLRLTEDLIREMNGLVKSQEQLIGLYRIEVNGGLVRWIDYLTVVNNYVQARNDLAGAEIGRLMIINQLNYLR